MYSFTAANRERVNVDAEFALLWRLKNRIYKKDSAWEANVISQRLFSFFLMIRVVLFYFGISDQEKGK